MSESDYKIVSPIVFTLNEINEAIEAVPDVKGLFYFIYGNKRFTFKTHNSILFSERAKEEIMKDCTQNEYILRNYNYDSDFLQIFFNSILDGSISIQPKHFINLAHLCDELKISRLNSLIETNLLTYLCDMNSNDNKNLETKEDKYAYIGSHIKLIDPEKLRNIPFNFLSRIFFKINFENEDEKANFLISNETFGIDFISYVRFEDLTLSTLGRVLARIEKDENKSILIDNLISRCKKEINERKEIKIVNITINDYPKLNRHSIDFSFLEKLNTKCSKYSIKVKTFYENEILQEFNKSEDYLINNCDILVFGGLDGFQYIISRINTKVFDKMREFNNKNGFILLLHDTIDAKTKFFYEKLCITEIDNCGGYTEIEFNDNSEKFDILSTPFKFSNKTIHIAANHNNIGIENNSKCPIFCFKKSSHYYYFEDLNKNIAFCGIGHTNDIEEEEQKLFYNILCHEYENNHILKNIK